MTSRLGDVGDDAGLWSSKKIPIALIVYSLGAGVVGVAGAAQGVAEMNLCLSEIQTRTYRW
jgi:hypothetical protein